MNIALVKYTGNYRETVDKLSDIEKELDAYSFRNEIADLKEGDFVVVQSKNGLGIGLVTRLLDNTFENSGYANKATAYTVDKVDVTSLIAREEAKARRVWLERELKRKKAEMEDVLIFKVLADSDPEAAKMLEELKQLPR